MREDEADDAWGRLERLGLKEAYFPKKAQRETLVRTPRGTEKPKGSALHILRHTIASHMLASGVSIPTVSARLGHGDMQTTLRIYGHMIHGQDDEAVRKWKEYQQRNRVADPTSVQ